MNGGEQAVVAVLNIVSNMSIALIRYLASDLGSYVKVENAVKPKGGECRHEELVNYALSTEKGLSEYWCEESDVKRLAEICRHNSIPVSVIETSDTIDNSYISVTVTDEDIRNFTSLMRQEGITLTDPEYAVIKTMDLKAESFTDNESKLTLEGFDRIMRSIDKNSSRKYVYSPERQAGELEIYTMAAVSHYEHRPLMEIRVEIQDLDMLLHKMNEENNLSYAVLSRDTKGYVNEQEITYAGLLVFSDELDHLGRVRSDMDMEIYAPEDLFVLSEDNISKYKQAKAAISSTYEMMKEELMEKGVSEEYIESHPALKDRDIWDLSDVKDDRKGENMVFTEGEKSPVRNDEDLSIDMDIQDLDLLDDPEIFKRGRS